MRGEIRKYSKLADWVDESYGSKDYVKELHLEEVRTKFRIRTNMTDFAFNMRNKKEYSDRLWSCLGCNSNIETFLHVKWCEAYADLRQGIDLNLDKDLVWYISEVLKRRK